MAEKRTLTGSCHCGAVKFRIASALEEFTKCDCSLCRKKNALMVQVHESDFELLEGEDALALYQWNFRIARHHFCKHCGIYTFHRKRAAPDSYGVNVYCLDDLNVDTVPVRQASGASMSIADQA